MNLAFMPVQTPFVTESRVFTVWDFTNIWFPVLVLVFPEDRESKCSCVLGEDDHTVRRTS